MNTYNNKDLTIYNEIKNRAAEVFNYVEIPAGKYTAQDVATALSKKHTAKFVDGYDDYEFIKIDIEGFSCSFPNGLVFEILRDIATAWNIPTAYRAKFIKETETAATVATFVAPAAPAARQLKNSISKDDSRPVLGHLFLDIRRGCLVASNGHIMTVTPADSLQLSADVASNKEIKGYLIAPELLKDPKNQITINAKNMATNGAAAAPLYDAIYPDWHSVANIKLYNSMAINLGKSWNQIKKIAAALAKFTDRDCSPVIMHGESYTNKIELLAVKNSGEEKRETVELGENLSYSFAIAFNGSLLSKIERAEIIYLENSYKMATFSAPGFYTLLMPLYVEHPEDYKVNFNFDTLKEGTAADPLAQIIDTQSDDTAAPAAEIESETPATATDDAQSETPATAADDAQSDDTQSDDTAAPAAEIESETPAMAADDTQSDDAQSDDTAAPAAEIESETPATAADDTQSDDTQSDDTAAPAAELESETPATAAAMFADFPEIPTNDTAAPGFAAAPIITAAPVHFYTATAANIIDLNNDTQATRKPATAKKIHRRARYLLRIAATILLYLLLSMNIDRPTAGTAAPAAVPFIEIETPAPAAEIESETPATAADDTQSDDTAAPAAELESETPATAADDAQSDDTATAAAIVSTFKAPAINDAQGEAAATAGNTFISPYALIIENFKNWDFI